MTKNNAGISVFEGLGVFPKTTEVVVGKLGMCKNKAFCWQPSYTLYSWPLHFFLCGSSKKQGELFG